MTRGNEMKALFYRETGFDSTPPPVEVIILGFVFGSYQPGYQRTGTYSGVLAIVADGPNILTVETRHLKYIGDAHGDDHAGRKNNVA